MQPKITSYYYFIPIILVGVFFIWKATHFPIHDFANYYFGGKFLAEGTLNSTVYFPYEFNKSIADLGHTGIFVSYAPNTPFLALLFLPLCYLPLAAAKLLFNIISLVLLLYSLSKLIRFYNIKPIYLIAIPLLFLVPLKNNLLFGQVYFLLFFFMAESLLAYEKKQFPKMGLFLSLAIFLKVFPLLLLLIFIFRKELKPLLYTFAFCVLFLGISMLCSGFDIWIFYLKSVLPKVSDGQIATAYVDNYQSVFMFLKRILVWHPTENPTALLHQPVLFKALILAFKIAVISMGYFLIKKTSNTLYAFSYLILAAILISPYGSTYTFVVVLFAFLYGVKSEISMTKKVFLMALLFLINNIPFHDYLSAYFPFSYLRLLLLLLYFAWFISLHHKTIYWKWIVVLTLIPSVGFAFFAKEETIRSKPFLTGKKTPILVYDYSISKDYLTYFYWNEKGKNQKSIRLAKSDYIPLEIHDNQVFYHKKQLTFDSSTKLKPVLIHNETILYLTDYERGIGFYALRTIPLKDETK